MSSAVWKRSRLKYLAEMDPPLRRTLRLDDDMPVSFLPMEAVGEAGSLDLSRERPLSAVREGYTPFQDGDVIVAKITPCFENGKGALAAGLTNGVGFGTTELFVLRPSSGVDARFLNYLVSSDAFRQPATAQMYGAGGQKRVPPSFVQDFKFGVPDLTTQRAIADFLDRETAKIDALLAKKGRVRELLGEERASIVERLLRQATSGGPVKRVDSDWFPQMPADWSWLRLRDVASSIQTGPFGTQLHSSDYVAGGIPVVNPTNIVAGNLIPDPKCTVDDATASRLSAYALRFGDIVLARRGEMGRVAVVSAGQDGWLCGTGSMRVRISGKAVPEFVARVLATRGAREWLALHSVGSTMQNLNPTIVGGVSIPVPSVPEQHRILDEIRTQEDGSRELQGAVERGEARLREYRSALITAAVTGQIDVRHAS